MSLPEAGWSQRHPRGQVVAPHTPKKVKAKTLPRSEALVFAQKLEPRAFKRMREARLLQARLDKEKQEVKEGKKEEASTY